MTLKEFFEQNGNKPIEIQEDGTIRVLDEKGPWKPERGEDYYTVSELGGLSFLRWDDDGIDNKRLDMGNVFRTNAEANRALHRLRARKKFRDARGHEGPEAHKAFRERTNDPIWNVFPTREDSLFADQADYISAFEIWFESKEDCQKAIDSLTEDEKAALCCTGENE